MNTIRTSKLINSFKGVKPLICVMIIGCYFLCSCKEKTELTDDLEAVNDSSELEESFSLKFVKKGDDKNHKRQAYKEVGYEVKTISAIEFLEIEGENISSDDMDELKKESVFILDITSLSKSSRSPFTLKQCSLNKEKAIEYFSFKLEDKIHVKQNGESFQPTGSHFERDFGLSDRLRVILFFKNVDLNQSLEFFYQDNLFGAGKLNFIFEQNNLG